MIRELIAALKNLLTWFIMVSPWEQAIRVRAGKHVTLLGAGMHLRIPFLDRLFRQSVRRRTAIVPAATLTTKDEKTVTIGAYIGFEIVDLMTLYNTLHDADDTIVAEVSARIAQFVYERDLADAGPEAVAEHVKENISLERYGLGAIEFSLSNYAVVKTFRVITGEIKNWDNSDSLSTTQEHSPEAA